MWLLGGLMNGGIPIVWGRVGDEKVAALQIDFGHAIFRVIVYDLHVAIICLVKLSGFIQSPALVGPFDGFQ